MRRISLVIVAIVASVVFSLYTAMPARAQDATQPKPWLGIQLEPITGETANALGRIPGDGVLVSGVIINSPAQRAGVLPDDIIVSVDRQKVSEPGAISTLVGESLAGAPLQLEVLRDDVPLTLTAKLALRSAGATSNRDDSIFTSPTRSDADVQARRALSGASLLSLTPAIAEPLGLPLDLRGAVVAAVETGSAADEVGFRKGDVILSINRTPTPTAFSAGETFDKATDGTDRPALVLVRRGDRGVHVTLARIAEGFAQKLGPYWSLLSRKTVFQDGIRIRSYTWFDRGKVFGFVAYAPGTDRGGTYKFTLLADGRLRGDGESTTYYTVSGPNSFDYVLNGQNRRLLITITAEGVISQNFEIKRDGSTKLIDRLVERFISADEEIQLARAYPEKLRQAQAAQQAAAAEARASSGGGGFLSVLQGAIAGGQGIVNAGGGLNEALAGAAIGAAAVGVRG